MRPITVLRTLAIVTSTLVLLSACNRDSDTSSDAKPVVGVDYPRSDTDFWNSYIKYTPQYGKQLGLDLKTTNSQNDVAKLTANAQTFISQGVKGIAMAPQDTAAIAPTLAQLEAKKIPVVTVDTRPDSGNVFMVVRADNRAYGTKSCEYIGEHVKSGKVVQIMGDLASVNGRDRSEAFRACLKKYPGLSLLEIPAAWKGEVAATALDSLLTANPDVKAIYMQAGGVYLSPTLQTLRRKQLLFKAGDPKHIVIVSNDGIPQEYEAIRRGEIDATISQPADLYAKYGLFYIKAALAGQTFKPGPTDHGSTIVQRAPGILEDQLPAPLVTKSNVDDKSLWGNTIK